MGHDHATTDHEDPQASPRSLAVRVLGARVRGRSCPANLCRGAQTKQTISIEYTSGNRAPSGRSSSREPSNTRHGFRLKLTKYAKTIERYTGPPGQFALGLFCLFSIWLSCRSNDLAEQALIESRRQTALAEWSARLEFIQYCNTLPAWNASTSRLCDSTLSRILRAPPTLPQEDGPRSFDANLRPTQASPRTMSRPAAEPCGGGSLRRRNCNDRNYSAQHDTLDDRRLQGAVEQPYPTVVNPGCQLYTAPPLPRVGVDLNSTIHFPTFEPWSDMLELDSQTQTTRLQGFQLYSLAVCLFAVVCALIVFFKKRYEVRWWKAKLD
jgi:hypothetical protein